MLWSVSAEEPLLRPSSGPSLSTTSATSVLMFVILWAYLSFSQLLVTWMGNTQEDVVWYIQRTSGGWKWLTIALIVLHFFLPFLLLLSQENKRRIRVLGTLAAGLLLLRLLDCLYLVPHRGQSDRPTGVSWLDLVSPVGIGGIWLAAYLWILSLAPLLPAGEVVSLEDVSHVKRETSAAV